MFLRAARFVKMSGKLLKNEVDRNSRRVVGNKLEKIAYPYIRECIERRLSCERRCIPGKCNPRRCALWSDGYRKYSPRLFREFSCSKFISLPGEYGFASVPILYDYHMFVTAYHWLSKRKKAYM